MGCIRVESVALRCMGWEGGVAISSCSSGLVRGTDTKA